MLTEYDQKLAEAYAAGRRAGIAEMQSEGIINDQGAAPLVGTGEMVGPLAVRHWKAPFRYDAEGQTIWDANNERALDVRGWGYLTGQGALGLPDAKAEKIMDDFGQSVVRILNAQWPNDSYQPTPGNGAAKQGEHPK